MPRPVAASAIACSQADPAVTELFVIFIDSQTVISQSVSGGQAAASATTEVVAKQASAASRN